MNLLLSAAVSLAGLAAPMASDVTSPPETGRLARAMVDGPAVAELRPAPRRPDPPAGAIRLLAWSEGGTYRLDTVPGQVSDIALQPGEILGSVAAGDTARWVIGDTSSGSGRSRRAHVLVKPVAAGLSTNLIIATDRRTYHVELRSSGRAGSIGIEWTYPADSLIALEAAKSAAPSEPAAADVAVERLNFNYRIEGDSPSWRPVRAFDDGRQVFIQFPPSLAQGEAPPLFVRSGGGRLELVNYRVKGLYYVVDRLFAAAELRSGERRQTVVRILRSDGNERGRTAS